VIGHGEWDTGFSMRQADPVEARKGTFIRSFDRTEYTTMLQFIKDMEKCAKRMKLKHREFVYTQISHKGSYSIASWQVFLMPEGWSQNAT
jgi:hypothetical protein